VGEQKYMKMDGPMDLGGRMEACRSDGLVNSVDGWTGWIILIYYMDKL
jgi:hypothetical protein